MNAALITEAYREQQAALHAVGNYGTTGEKFGPVVSGLVRASGATCLLDYGCGSRRSLLKTLQLPEGVIYEGYDPAVPDYADPPVPADLVCCIDVLEHIEPDLLDNVLEHLSTLCDPFGFFTIHTGPAGKVLADGRNAHLIQQPSDWWTPRLQRYFEVIANRPTPNGFCVLVKVRGSQAPTPPGITQPLSLLGGDEVGAAATKAQSAQAALMGLDHGGVKMVFNAPNQMTRWRVKSFYEKEPDTVRWLQSIPEGAILLDVGANVGMYSVFAAKVSRARVYAFEPESQNYALLNANIAINGLSSQVTAYPVALSDTMALDKLYLSEFSAGTSCHSFGAEVGFDLKPRKSGFEQGSVSMTLDQLVESGSVPVPDYIKLDVDGFEHKVMQGAAKTLQNPKVRSVIVELNTNLQEHLGTIEMLKQFGFSYDEQQAKGALRKEGAFLGVGEYIFNRGGVAQPALNLNREARVHVPRSARGRKVLDHVLQKLGESRVTRDPFPYLIIDEIFPADYYQEMLAHFPDESSLRPLAESGRLGSASQYPERFSVLFNEDEFARMTDAQQAFWGEFADWLYCDQFVAGFMSKFAQDIELRVSRILEAEGELKVRGDALLVNDRTRYAIGPHTDARHRLISFLFYMPADNSMRELGTSIYRHKDPAFVCPGGPHHGFENFTRVKTVEFLPNRLFAFPKTDRCFHGVEPITRPDINRPLLINNIRLLNKTTG